MLRKGLGLVAILLVVSATIGPTWAVAEETSDPYLRVDVYNHSIMGFDWTAGRTVTLTIDDNPTTEPGVDYQDSLVVPDDYPCYGGNVCFSPDREDFQLAPGQLVTLEDSEGLKRELTVTTLTVTLVDPDADTISGTADPDTPVWVGAWGYGEFTERLPTADEDGNWVADFSKPGDDPREAEVIDIAPGLVCFWVADVDGDGDWTAIFWPYSPRFDIRSTLKRVISRGWLEEATVTLSIYDSADEELLYTASQVAAPEGDEWHATSAVFGLPDHYDIEPSQIVRMNDGVSFKEHVVMDIAVTDVDLNADVVTGSATPGAELVVNVWEGFRPSREVVADGDGEWVADFSDGDDAYDIDATTTGAVFGTDEDSDSTVVDWNAHLQVDIDIKPGSSKNSLNLGSQGLLAVALLHTESFDVNTANPTTVQFAEATPLRWSLKDVDSDEDLDLLFQFAIPDLGLFGATTSVRLRGETYEGRIFEGWDSVNIVP